jgi:hypothetical protein
MKITAPVAQTVARPTTTTRPAVETKPALEGKPAVGIKPMPGHSIVDGGCFPPFPRPTADAHARTQGRQIGEIADGVRNGSITEQEAEKLLKQQQELTKAHTEAKADGKVTKEEALRLRLMEAKANLSIHMAANNKDRDVFARFDGDAQRQANQLDQLANGRSNGNITNSEASKLLGQQVAIADARGDADSPIENFMLDRQLDQADRDIKHHSRPGTQFGPFKPPFPTPLPLPFPRPLPLPELPRPLPLPELPRKPDFQALPVFPRDIIA